MKQSFQLHNVVQKSPWWKALLSTRLVILEEDQIRMSYLCWCQKKETIDDATH